MKKPRRKRTVDEKAARKRYQAEFMTIFINFVMAIDSV